MEKIDYKMLRYKIYEQYGVELDETSLIIQHILRDYQVKQFDEQNQTINTAAEAISQSQKTLAVDTQHPRWQAFWFGFGKLGFAIVFAVAVMSIFLTVYLNSDSTPAQTLSNEQSYQLNWYKTYYILSQKDNPKELKHFMKEYPAPKN